MNKDIKFRAWDELRKIMYSSKCINLLLHFDGKLQSTDDKGNILGTINTPEMIIMQYTGLKDKNGKEIYEGDILEFTWEEDSCWGNEGTYKGYVQHNDGGYEVVYINRQECTPTKDGGIHPNSKSDDLQSFIRWTNEINIEVIGNIYQDSELLEVSNGQH